MTFLSDVSDYVNQCLRSTICDSYVTKYNFREWFYDMMMTIVFHRYIVREWYDCHNHIIISFTNKIRNSYVTHSRSSWIIWHIIISFTNARSSLPVAWGCVMCVTCLIHMWDMPHSQVWRASSICVTCLILMCDMPHSYVWHASFICVTCLIHVCDTHIYIHMWHTHIYTYIHSHMHRP